MDSKIFREDIASQQPALILLKDLGYDYISPDTIDNYRKSEVNNQSILTEILKERLMEINSYEYKGKVYKFPEKVVDQAIADLDIPLNHGLVRTNEKIYDLLLLGKSYKVFLEEEGNYKSFSFRFIDWDNIDNNSFHVTDEFKLQRDKVTINSEHLIPDLAVFVNGIPFGIIEAKRPSIDLDEAISQMIRNQKKGALENLFKYVQITMAINQVDTKYATCGTPKEFYNTWREEDLEWQEKILKKYVKNRTVTKQDRDIVSIFSKERLFELVYNFIVFDKNVKKICRYQQYFGIKSILERIEERDELGNRKSGVVWHTQGSGKSLTMVMLARYIFRKYKKLDPKVIVVTDRIELDNQICSTFAHTDLRPNKANSGEHLVKLINDDSADIVTTIINKFEKAIELNEPVKSQNIFVLVDESHRTQYGKFHNNMKKLFPNACYLGFTGTPIMKKDKNTMMKFGDLVHTYTINDAVRDKTILPLYYEGRMVNQEVNQKAIDKHLENITRNLSDEHKKQLMQEWSNYSKIASSSQRIRLVANEIIADYIKRLKDTKFNAMFATTSKKEAVDYYENFKEINKANNYGLEFALVISENDSRKGHEDIDEETEDKVGKFFEKILEKYNSIEEYESIVKQNFIEGDIDILIVVDKLLTGFDAPNAQVLYIDKPLKEHNLLQAIARVNRVAENKDYGLIIDYRGLFEELNTAMDMYSGAGLELFDKEDLKNLLLDADSVINQLRQDHTNLVNLFEKIKNKDDNEEYQVFLRDKKIRDTFYELLTNFSKSLKLAISIENAYNKIEEELKIFNKDLKFFIELRKNVSYRYNDKIDTKLYHQSMQNLINENIQADDIYNITNKINLNDKQEVSKELKRFESYEAKADIIMSRLNSSISEHCNEDPYYYEKFSEMIKRTLEKYKDKRISEKEYFQTMLNLKDENEDLKDLIVKYPKNIKNNGTARAFYGILKENIEKNLSENLVKEGEADYLNNNENNLEEDIADLSLDLCEKIKSQVKVDWHKNIDVKNNMAQEIDDALYDFHLDKNITLDMMTLDIMINKILEIAKERF